MSSGLSKVCPNLPVFHVQDARGSNPAACRSLRTFSGFGVAKAPISLLTRPDRRLATPYVESDRGGMLAVRSTVAEILDNCLPRRNCEDNDGPVHRYLDVPAPLAACAGASVNLDEVVAVRNGTMESRRRLLEIRASIVECDDQQNKTPRSATVVTRRSMLAQRTRRSTARLRGDNATDAVVALDSCTVASQRRALTPCHHRATSTHLGQAPASTLLGRPEPFRLARL